MTLRGPFWLKWVTILCARPARPWVIHGQISVWLGAIQPKGMVTADANFAANCENSSPLHGGWWGLRWVGSCHHDCWKIKLAGRSQETRFWRVGLFLGVYFWLNLGWSELDFYWCCVRTLNIICHLINKCGYWKSIYSKWVIFNIHVSLPDVESNLLCSLPSRCHVYQPRLRSSMPAYSPFQQPLGPRLWRYIPHTIYVW